MEIRKNLKLDVVIVLCIITMVGIAGWSHYEIFHNEATDRQRTTEEVDWIGSCVLFTGHSLQQCRQDADELVGMGYFTTMPDVGVIQN